jgi:hypothetical protein
MTPQSQLQERDKLTERLSESPYDPSLYLERAAIYLQLCYPDLAIGDANKALLLTDEIVDEVGEYHDEAVAALSTQSSRYTNGYARHRKGIIESAESVQQLSRNCAQKSYQILSKSLLSCGCHKSALEFCKRGLKAFPQDTALLQAQERVLKAHRQAHGLDEGTAIDIEDLSEQGHVRREVYPWNQHEPDRFSPESLEHLNKQIEKVAPKCEVRAVGLPVISNHALTGKNQGHIPVQEKEASNVQLGIFATQDIAPGEILLREVSYLTASNRPHDPFCDACNAPLPPFTDSNATAVACPDCDDAVFCTPACLEAAQDFYHGALCGLEVDVLSAERVGVKYSANTLYLLLLRRALAMATFQEKHPLELEEVKYIWGDFSSSLSNPNYQLPFTFHHNVGSPLAILTKMDINIFDPPVKDLSEVWVMNTLYAKFRGTASAFLSPVSQKPETSVVHPMWCLANHDCDPNVAWDWTGGEIKFWARTPEERVPGSMGEAGVKAGNEIRSHYCDVGMSATDRQEWALGSLGGICKCGRCARESVGATEKKA